MSAYSRCRKCDSFPCSCSIDIYISDDNKDLDNREKKIKMASYLTGLPEDLISNLMEEYEL